jgi:hypothetical protein
LFILKKVAVVSSWALGTASACFNSMHTNVH